LSNNDDNNNAQALLLDASESESEINFEFDKIKFEYDNSIKERVIIKLILSDIEYIMNNVNENNNFQKKFKNESCDWDGFVIYDESRTETHSLKSIICLTLKKNTVYISDSNDDNTGGVDGNICGSESLPCLTLSEAVTHLNLNSVSDNPVNTLKIKIIGEDYILNSTYSYGDFTLMPSSLDETTKTKINLNNELCYSSQAIFTLTETKSLTILLLSFQLSEVFSPSLFELPSEENGTLQLFKVSVLGLSSSGVLLGDSLIKCMLGGVSILFCVFENMKLEGKNGTILNAEVGYDNSVLVSDTTFKNCELIGVEGNKVGGNGGAIYLKIGKKMDFSAPSSTCPQIGIFLTVFFECSAVKGNMIFIESAISFDELYASKCLKESILKAVIPLIESDQLSNEDVGGVDISFHLSFYIPLKYYLISLEREFFISSMGVDYGICGYEMFPCATFEYGVHQSQ
jgi:hypothetical protein